MSEPYDAENTISNSNVIFKNSQIPETERLHNLIFNPYANPFILYTPIPEFTKSLSQDILDIGEPSTQILNYHSRGALNPHANPFFHMFLLLFQERINSSVII